jgi:L-ascorbate metabolism protein UlaG (beta-lactamase superfamily)
MSPSYLPRHGACIVPPGLRFLGRYLGGYFRQLAPAPHEPEPARWRDDAVTAAWLGHATVLTNFRGVRILTDPVLGSHCGIALGPFVLGPKRYVEPALNIAELPPLDIVLLTHAHMDHFDIWTLGRIDRGATVVTARSTRDLLDGIGFTKIIELDWDAAAEIETANGPVRIEAFRVKHWGARMGRDTHRGFNGYLIEREGRRICIAGDTAFTDFSHVARRGPIDLMAVPIGGYDPWIANHCTPEEAVAMADQVGAKFVMPVHHQTFKLSWEPMGEPIERFKDALARERHRIATTEIGETFVLP